MSRGLANPYPLEEEYKKKTGITPQDIDKLRDWLKTQPHLPGDLITDMDLILALHSCQCSTTVTKQVLDLHFTLRTLFRGLFHERRVDEHLSRVLHVVLSIPLEMRAHDESAVVYVRLLDYDSKNFVFSDTMRAILMVLDLWQQEQGTWPGLVILIDMDCVTLGHIAKLDFQTLQHFMYYLQEAMLVRLKGVHYLNAPSFMDKVLMILRPFMKKPLLDILHIHQIGAHTLDEFVPRVALPKEAGGTYKTFEQARDDMISKLQANSKYFELENKKRVTESRRPGKPKTITDIFGGVEGSFKQLEID